MIEFLDNPWIDRVGLVAGGLLLGILVERVVVRRVRKLTELTRFKWDNLLVDSLHGVPIVWLGAGGVYLALKADTADPLLVNTIQNVLMVLVMGSVVVAGMRLAGGVVEMVSGRAGGVIKSPTLVVNLARVAVGVLGIFIILQTLGINITAAITALGIGGIAVALALQDTLGNLFAGVQIILSRQLRQGDYIRLSSGEEGWVTDVKGRNTTIQTFPDGNLVVVPNSLLASSIVKNFSMPRAALWVSVEVGVSYDSDLEHVEAVVLDVAKDVLGEVDGGLPAEDPIVRYHSFADSSVNFEVRMMVREFESQGPMRHEFIKRLHRRFTDEGIEIPFPIRTVVMKGGTAAPAQG